MTTPDLAWQIDHAIGRKYATSEHPTYAGLRPAVWYDGPLSPSGAWVRLVHNPDDGDSVTIYRFAGLRPGRRIETLAWHVELSPGTPIEVINAALRAAEADAQA
jgi:hypothetical protein